MTNAEFKAWFDGFSENIGESPSVLQWTRIKTRIAEIDDKPVTERVFVDRYWPGYYQQAWHYPPRYTLGGYGGSLQGGTYTTSAVGATGVGVGNLNQAAVSNTMQGLQANHAVAQTYADSLAYASVPGNGGQWDSARAMYALGKSEANT